MNRSPENVIGAAALLICTLALQAEDFGQTRVDCGTPWTTYKTYDKWFDAYDKLHPDIKIHTLEFASKDGIQMVSTTPLGLCATNFAMTEEQIRIYKGNRGCTVLHIPTTVCGVVPVYNVPGAGGGIKFTARALAGIYLGTITKWNDPEIQNSNQDRKLPPDDIVVVHRGDEDDSTYVWTDYLSKVSKDWKEKVGVGIAVKWPIGLGPQGGEGVSHKAPIVEGDKGEPGLVPLIQEMPNSIGYADLQIALKHKMDCGAVQNTSGKFITADAKSLTAAAAGAAKDMSDDFRTSITNAPGDQAYPIASFSTLLVPAQIKDKDDRGAIVGFLKWMLADGQKMLQGSGFGPLPPAMAEKEIKAIDKISG